MWISEIPATPPDAITDRSVARARSTVASILTPLSSPSRPTSVNSRLATPASSNRRAISTTDTSDPSRSEEHTSELQSLMRISYAVLCLKTKTNIQPPLTHSTQIYT